MSRRRILGSLSAALSVLVVGGCAAPAPAPGPSRTAPGPAVTTAGLVVARDGSGAGYSRAAFDADGWPDAPDGCSVRQHILARDLTATDRRGRCTVVSGTLADPYSATTVTGPVADDQVDHVVPLALAWRTGAASWTPQRRAAFAVDPLELQTTVGALNDAKGDKGPERWMPPANQCHYAQTFTRVLLTYRLTVSPARKAALDRALGTC